jgi:hypothetical protein
LSEMTHASDCNRHALAANRHVHAGFNPHFEFVPQPVRQMPWGMCAPMLA